MPPNTPNDGPAKPGGEASDPFAVAREGYIDRLPATMDALAANVRAIRADPNDGLAWEEARSRAHKLKGTAGTYGLNEISETAGQLETAILHYASVKDLTNENVVEIERLLEALLMAVTRPGKGPPSGAPPAGGEGGAR